MNPIEFLPGQLAGEMIGAIKQAEDDNVAKRIWRKDGSLWKEDEAHQKIIKNSLGWLVLPDEMIAVADELIEFSELIRGRNYRHVMVCGMGGSSLCPEVLAQTFGPQPGYPELLVLDSTDPDVLAAYENRIEIERCLFVIASKSGTTTEPNVFYKFWYDQLGKRSPNPAENFIAITDPGSLLVERAAELGFQRVFLNQADIGGRYSALSYFGMVPAALMGIDLKKLLDRAKQMAQACAAVMPAAANPAVQLGTFIGGCARAGRDKLTLVTDEKIASLGLWIEQLIAESTGKEGKGILSVAGEPLGGPAVYGQDRVFVSLSIGTSIQGMKSKLDALTAAGHPAAHRQLTDLYDLGAEFFLWEFATACAGWRLGINPFDQPNVQESKDATKELLSTFVNQGSLPEQTPLVAENELTIFAEGHTREALPATSVSDALRGHLAMVKQGDYIALLNYIEETPAIEARLQEIRTLLRDTTKCATTTGYGPRFLHSTGQMHKGGPDTGVFFQITAKDAHDFPVPGEPHSFSILKQAQALGDFRSLVAHGRRALRVDLGADVLAGLQRLHELIAAALPASRGAGK
jgi:transaldolase/glucose-6-phosphate isomerase